MDINGMISTFFGSFEVYARILIACGYGTVIGLGRKIRHKMAGARTHIIVALGSVMTTVVSLYGFAGEGLDADPSRLASNIITGVGFLGAGLIFMKGGTIKGLTTAAGIWTTAAIGIAVGCGMYAESALATLILAVIQLLPSENKRRAKSLRKKNKTAEAEEEYEDTEGEFEND